jgi:hypothetical protein
LRYCILSKSEKINIEKFRRKDLLDIAGGYEIIDSSAREK